MRRLASCWCKAVALSTLLPPSAMFGTAPGGGDDIGSAPLPNSIAGMSTTEMWAARGTPDEPTDGDDETSDPYLSPPTNSDEEDDTYAKLALGRESLLDRVRAAIGLALQKANLQSSLLHSSQIDVGEMSLCPMTSRLRTVLEVSVPMTFNLPVEDESLEIVSHALGDAYAAGLRPSYSSASIKHFTRVMPFWLAFQDTPAASQGQLAVIANVSSQLVEDAFLVVTVRLHSKSDEGSVMCWSTSLLKLTPPLPNDESGEMEGDNES